MLVAPPLAALVVAALGCGGSRGADEPTTAKQKLAQEQEAQPSDAKAGTKKWGKWRYQGDRTACFYEVAGKCFKTEKAACSAAKCKATATCVSAGAAPAQVSCKAAAARR